ncbi:chromosome segregation protein SMC [Aciduricibacillus chroicocephali]|uniref:Chromosome partition protein Smc n=1 Tax=Aciduricibacillus chroicocephali TaxID=3054939 RepID=A0ABY9KY79_9BACI|nr:chromosome segregation protein SMC [Bacillaceae bacterium 44XB]
MYLKRLETVGFKSFAERIDLEFMPGMTAVVGPNGSGKSNITEAVRWVLGEQSAKSLRGAKMEDIIFQGSAGRKALNMAEVTIVLDNESQSLPLDFAEVSITRRVYRSGESEFYINRKSCRLKDIIDLFLDSGLGREAFSMISQGRVEEILSSKAEQRRTIFEEAAGVLKYKQRKQKAEYKLAETEMNLERVRDIAGELEQQIEPLELQADKAKQYKELANQRKSQEISILLAEIEQFHGEWKSLLDQLKEGEIREIAWKRSIGEQESKIEKEKKSLDELDGMIEEDQAMLVKLTEQIEQATGKREVLLERSRHAEAFRQKTTQEKERLGKQLNEIEYALKACRSEVDEKEFSYEELLKKIAQLERLLSELSINRSHEIENLKSDYIELLSKKAALSNEKKAVAEQLDKLSSRTDSEHDRTDHLHTKLKENERFIEKAKAYRYEVIKQVESSRANQHKNRDAISALQNELQRLRDIQYRSYEKVTKLQSRKEMLETMKAEMQGFQFGTKEILQAMEAGKLQGIKGAVIQLITVPDHLTDAIETALGGGAQHLVAENEAAARSGIAWLKQNKKGRATFLPLKTIEARRLPDSIIRNIEKHSGYIGIGSDLIKFEAESEPAIRHLLGNVVIAADLRAANEIAALCNRRYRIVTIDGDVVNPGGSMSGGTKRKTGTSIFSRKKELIEVHNILTEEEKVLASSQNEHREAEKRLSILKHEFEDAEKTLTTYSEKLAMAERSLQERELEKESLENQLAMQQQGNSDFRIERDELLSKQAEIREQLEALQNQILQMDKHIKDLVEADEKNKQKQTKVMEQLHAAQLELAKTGEQLQALYNRSALHDEQRSAIKAELVELNESLNFADEAQTEKLVQQLDKETRSAAKEKENVLARLRDIRQKRHDRTKRLQDAEQELKAENRLLQAFSKDRQNQEIHAARLDVSLDSKLETLQEEYNITHEKASSIYEKCENLEQGKIQLSQLNKQIERLGTVNLGAIEEFERISERFRFLTEQETDLITAMHTLNGAITELDGEMERRFAETFYEIQKEFSQVFQELFGGGRAELTLTDPGNLLGTGIEIVAEPPGKKLKALSLLSGGERALTAIALLFSILRVRPVPFCILDEVEAALDEANVVRFAKYLHAHSRRTQFIVITHRKGTMEEADALFGVTMEESGVSRLVSVKLSDAEDLVNI